MMIDGLDIVFSCCWDIVFLLVFVDEEVQSPLGEVISEAFLNRA